MKTLRPQSFAPALKTALPIVLLAAWSACSPQQPSAQGSATTPPTTASNPPAGPPCPVPPPCGDDCSNQPFERTDCWTTKYGPARADVVLGNPLKSTNLLYCSGGSYALCYFSGPPYATGTSADNRPLPCVLEGDVANCTCQVYTSGPYFVVINDILNLGAYYETVQACGHDGSGCANITNCGPDGRLPGCADQKVAPVCQYVQNQNPDDPSTSLMPKADLISTFSLAMDGDYRLGTTACTGLYAGCMTAPCFFPQGAAQPPADGDPVQCQCPTYDGPFQVGQSGQECGIPGDGGGSWVWSASYTAGD
jgi:hypothetical protein